MSNMHITVYQALNSINMSPEQASAVVQSMDDHIVEKVSQASRPFADKVDELKAFVLTQNGILLAQLGAKIDGLEAGLGAQIAILDGRISSIEKRLDTRTQLVRWVIATAIGTAGLGIAFLKAVGKL